MIEQEKPPEPEPEEKEVDEKGWPVDLEDDYEDRQHY